MKNVKDDLEVIGLIVLSLLIVSITSALPISVSLWFWQKAFNGFPTSLEIMLLTRVLIVMLGSLSFFFFLIGITSAEEKTPASRLFFNHLTAIMGTIIVIIIAILWIVIEPVSTNTFEKVFLFIWGFIMSLVAIIAIIAGIAGIAGITLPPSLK